MSKKVIGIAVIAGLDLAFIILMQAGWENTEVSRNIDPPNRYEQSLTQKQSLPELTAPDYSDSIGSDEIEESNRIVRTASKATNERSYYKRNAVHSQRRRRAKNRPTEAESSTPKFTDTVIYVERSEPFQFQQVSLVEPTFPTSEPVVEIRPEQKRKSFFSRAAPIVKKPYEWLKDLAEKLK